MVKFVTLKQELMDDNRPIWPTPVRSKRMQGESDTVRGIGSAKVGDTPPFWCKLLTTCDQCNLTDDTDTLISETCSNNCETLCDDNPTPPPSPPTPGPSPGPPSGSPSGPSPDSKCNECLGDFSYSDHTDIGIGPWALSTIFPDKKDCNEITSNGIKVEIPGDPRDCGDLYQSDGRMCSFDENFPDQNCKVSDKYSCTSPVCGGGGGGGGNPTPPSPTNPPVPTPPTPPPSPTVQPISDDNIKKCLINNYVGSSNATIFHEKNPENEEIKDCSSKIKTDSTKCTEKALFAPAKTVLWNVVNSQFTTEYKDIKFEDMYNKFDTDTQKQLDKFIFFTGNENLDKKSDNIGDFLPSDHNIDIPVIAYLCYNYSDECKARYKDTDNSKNDFAKFFKLGEDGMYIIIPNKILNLSKIFIKKTKVQECTPENWTPVSDGPTPPTPAPPTPAPTDPGVVGDGSICPKKCGADLCDTILPQEQINRNTFPSDPSDLKKMQNLLEAYCKDGHQSEFNNNCDFSDFTNPDTYIDLKNKLRKCFPKSSVTCDNDTVDTVDNLKLCSCINDLDKLIVYDLSDVQKDGKNKFNGIDTSFVDNNGKLITKTTSETLTQANKNKAIAFNNKDNTKYKNCSPSSEYESSCSCEKCYYTEFDSSRIDVEKIIDNPDSTRDDTIDLIAEVTTDNNINCCYGFKKENIKVDDTDYYYCSFENNTGKNDAFEIIKTKEDYPTPSPTKPPTTDDFTKIIDIGQNCNDRSRYDTFESPMSVDKDETEKFSIDFKNDIDDGNDKTSCCIDVLKKNTGPYNKNQTYIVGRQINNGICENTACNTNFIDPTGKIKTSKLNIIYSDKDGNNKSFNWSTIKKEDFPNIIKANCCTNFQFFEFQTNGFENLKNEIFNGDDNNYENYKSLLNNNLSEINNKNIFIKQKSITNNMEKGNGGMCLYTGDDKENVTLASAFNNSGYKSQQIDWSKQKPTPAPTTQSKCSNSCIINIAQQAFQGWLNNKLNWNNANQDKDQNNFSTIGKNLHENLDKLNDIIKKLNDTKSYSCGSDTQCKNQYCDFSSSTKGELIVQQNLTNKMTMINNYSNNKSNIFSIMRKKNIVKTNKNNKIRGSYGFGSDSRLNLDNYYYFTLEDTCENGFKSFGGFDRLNDTDKNNLINQLNWFKNTGFTNDYWITSLENDTSNDAKANALDIIISNLNTNPSSVKICIKSSSDKGCSMTKKTTDNQNINPCKEQSFIDTGKCKTLDYVLPFAPTPPACIDPTNTTQCKKINNACDKTPTCKTGGCCEDLKCTRDLEKRWKCVAR